MSSSAVLADAQFGAAKVLRPFVGFEAVYQGLSGDTPIAIPGALAELAGKEGYNANLIAGAPVPFGAKLLFWFPTVLGVSGATYQYEFVWRLRNLQDFRQNRQAYHFPKQSLGVNSEYVIPASKKVVVYEGYRETSLLGGISNQMTSEAVKEAVVFNTIVAKTPKAPNGADATIQQGLGLAGSDADNGRASYNAVSMDAEGDELLIYVTKKDSVAPWDFTNIGGDLKFSNFFGNGTGKVYPDLGVYLFSGSNP